MTESSQPSDIARETLRRLAIKKLPPTPDNYRACYHEITGVPEKDTFPGKHFKAILAALPRDNPEQMRLARGLEQAVAAEDWSAVRQAVVQVFGTEDEPELKWSILLKDLVSQYERHHAGLTTARKRDSLTHVLDASGSDPAALFNRLSGLVRSWSQTGTADDAPMVPVVTDSEAALVTPEKPATSAAPTAPAASKGTASQPTTSSSPRLAGGLDRLLDTLLAHAIPALLGSPSELSSEAMQLAEAVRNADADLSQLSARLEAFSHKLEWAGEDQRAIRKALLDLIQLIIRNISQLVVDDHWLSGQLTILTEAFAGPIDIRTLDEVERRLREVIDKQGKLKRELTDAQARLKVMLAGFVDRLAEFSTSTGEYHDTLSRCAKRIQDASDINQLSDVVEDLMRETRVTQEIAARSKDELADLRHEVDQAHQLIGQLQKELDETSELVRHDPLTGTLNRKGLDETLSREIARCRRRGSPLSLSLLDVDNFKQLNDTHGHKVGDDALIHLTEVVRDSLRPQDSVGRYGGEEFLIVLPDTDANNAMEILTRLQRELTRRFFLADSSRILITFSAGVTQMTDEEEPVTTISRADKAMYSAKRAGKNRVLCA